MATVALFGITGKTGTVLARKLLDKNYQIKALVRNASKVTLSSPNLTIVEGNIVNADRVKKTIDDTQAVINVIGHVKGCPADLQTTASKWIIEAMIDLKIKRLINLTGGGVFSEGDHPDLLDRSVLWIMKNLLGKAMRDRLTDGDTHVKLICNTNLDWTVVRAPVLLSMPEKGTTFIGPVGHIPGHSLTFADLAEEIVTILENDLYIRQMPYITNG